MGLYVKAIFPDMRFAPISLTDRSPRSSHLSRGFFITHQILGIDIDDSFPPQRIIKTHKNPKLLRLGCRRRSHSVAGSGYVYCVAIPRACLCREGVKGL